MTSERTADADVATIREVLLIEKGFAVTSSFHDPALAALDRLVARNQQLQEALAATDDLLRRLAEWDMLSTRFDGVPATADGPYWQREIARARAALASVRARSET